LPLQPWLAPGPSAPVKSWPSTKKFRVDAGVADNIKYQNDSILRLWDKRGRRISLIVYDV
jgi:hypothetical protein